MTALSRIVHERKIVLVYTVLTVVLVALALAQAFLPPGSGRAALGALFGGLVLAGLAAWAAKHLSGWLKELEFTARDHAVCAAVLLAAAVAGFFLIRYFFSLEQDIKIYDAVVYWEKVITDKALLEDSIARFLQSLRGTLNYDYTHLASFFLIPASYFFGLEFAGFAQAIFLVYYLPACVFLSVFAFRLSTRGAGQGAGPGFAVYSGCFLLCVLHVGLWWTMMHGYLDIVGVLLIALMLNVSLDWDGADVSLGRNVALACLSLALILSRRWYAYYIIGFYCSFGVHLLLDMAARREFSLKRIGRLFMSMGMIAGFCCLVLFLLNPNIFSTFLARDYAGLFAAYKNTDLWGNLWSLARNFGLLLLAACCAGVFFLLKNRESRLIAVRLLVAAGVAAILFCRVQDMGTHHQLLVVPTLLVFLCAFLAYAARLWSRGKAAALAVPLFAACLVSFVFACTPSLEGLAGKLTPLTTALRGYPRQEPNYALIREMVADLERKIGNTSKHVYVVGDGYPLSPEVLKRSDMPERVDAAPYVFVNSIVDLRDGFPSQAFLADYILLSDPFRTEFPATQQVGYQLYDMLVNDPQLAPYYELDATYRTRAENMLLFRKIRFVDRECVDFLKQRLEAFYPENPFVFAPDYMITLGQIDGRTGYGFDAWGRFFRYAKKAGEPLEMLRVSDTASFSRMTFVVRCDVPGMDLVVRNQNGEIDRIPLEGNAHTRYDKDIPRSEYLSLSITERAGNAPAGGGVTLYPQGLR